MMNFEILSRFFGKQTLGGSHPNCESATILVSDGEKYVPISSYLNVPLSESLSRLRKLDKNWPKSPDKFTPTWRRWLFDASTLVQTALIMARGINLRKTLEKPYFLTE